jgi:hypothetical protein
MEMSFAIIVFFSVAIAGEPADSQNPADLVSYIPSDGLEFFIVDRLDITSFRNSLGPARSPGMRYFRDLGLIPTEISEGRIVFDTGDWYYSVEVVERRDVNQDGIEDILIRFTDDSTFGTYLTHFMYTLTCYSEGSDLIAIAFGPSNRYWNEADPALGAE